MRRNRREARAWRVYPVLLSMVGGTGVLPGVGLFAGVTLPGPGAALAQEVEAVEPSGTLSPASIKSDFDAAMGKPLSERLPLLEAYDARLSSALGSGELTGKDKTEALYYQYHTRRQMARYDEAQKTYTSYLRSVKDWGGVTRACSSFEADMQTFSRAQDYIGMSGTSKAVVDAFGDAPELASAALYFEARALYRQNGALERAVASAERLIEEYPQSDWRPHAMRLLANSEYGLGKYKESLESLAMLKAQYPGTKLEQYADMRPAAIWETRGEPQKALQIYQQTLKTFPDHVYAPYIHRQIERLQRVIEEQLIRDALEGLGRVEPHPAEGDVQAATAQTTQPSIVSDSGELRVTGNDETQPRSAKLLSATEL